MISENSVQLPSVFCTFSKPKKPSLWAPAPSWLSKPHKLGSVRRKGSEVKPPEGNRNTWAETSDMTAWKCLGIPQLCSDHAAQWLQSGHQACQKNVGILWSTWKKLPHKSHQNTLPWQIPWCSSTEPQCQKPEGEQELTEPKAATRPFPKPANFTTGIPIPSTCTQHSLKEKNPCVSWSSEIIQVFLGKAYKAH